MDALLHTLVLTSGYLSYGCLPISFKESGCFLTFDISKAHWMFSHFGPFSVTLEMVVWENLAPTNMPHSKLRKSPNPQFQLHRIDLAMSAYLIRYLC